MSPGLLAPRALPVRPSGRPHVNKLPPAVEIPCGSTKRNPPASIAWTAARKLARAGGAALTLTIDPDGLCYLEPPAVACPDDIVGTYTGVMPFTLEKAMVEDIRHFLELRKENRRG